MAIEYRLTLVGDVPLEHVARLAAPNASERLTRTGKRMLTANLDHDCGYTVDISAGSDGYYDAEADGSQWVWEPDAYVDVDFRMCKDAPSDAAILNMLTAVARVLAGRTEDAALVMNGNWLLLTRLGGVLRKHNLAEWYDYAYDGILS